MPTEGQVQGASAGGGIPVPKPTPATPASLSPIPAPVGGHVVIRPLRTYKDDLAEAIKKGNLSKTSIALAEKDRQARKQVPITPKPAPKPVPPPPHPAPKPTAPTPSPTTPKPVAPVIVAPKPPVAPPHEPEKPAIQPAPKAPTPPHSEKPITPAPEDAESKRRFFENLLHVRHEEGAASPRTAVPPVEKKSEPVKPPKSLAELLPKKESFSVVPAQNIPAPKPTPRSESVPIVPPQPNTPNTQPETASAKEVSPFLPFWATPDGQAPAVEHAPEPEPKPERSEVYTPLAPREDGPTRGSAVEDVSSGGVSLRPIAFAVGGMMLVVVLGFSGYLLFKQDPAGLPPIASEFPSHLVTVTSTATIDATDHAGFELANAFYEEVKNVSSGNAVGIIFAKTENGRSVPLTTAEWFAQARITPPGILIRALAPSFAAGSYESHNGGNAFFVFEAVDRDRALAGLFAWEKTLAGDMRPYLSTESLPGATFSDRTIGEVSVRIAGAGESALVYGMIDDRRIVITRGEGTFAGLVDALPQQTSTSAQ